MLLAPEPPPGRRIAFKAGKRGDTVTVVAKRYRDQRRAGGVVERRLAAGAAFSPARRSSSCRCRPGKPRAARAAHAPTKRRGQGQVGVAHGGRQADPASSSNQIWPRREGDSKL